MLGQFYRPVSETSNTGSAGFQPRSPWGLTPTGGPILRRQAASYSTGVCHQYGSCVGPSGIQSVGPASPSPQYAQALAPGGGTVYGQTRTVAFGLPQATGGRVSAGEAVSLMAPVADIQSDFALREIMGSQPFSAFPVAQQPEQADVVYETVSPSEPPAYMPTTPTQYVEESETSGLPTVVAEEAEGATQPWIWIALGLGAVAFLFGTMGRGRKATI